MIILAPLGRLWLLAGSHCFQSPLEPCLALTHCVSHQILQKVLQGCRENMLGTMALAACQFMEEPGMEVQVRESQHPYNNNTSFEVRSTWQGHPTASLTRSICFI